MNNTIASAPTEPRWARSLDHQVDDGHHDRGSSLASGDPAVYVWVHDDVPPTRVADSFTALLTALRPPP